MLVIISDLHLSDNSVTSTLDAGAFQLLREQLTALATKASWRSDEVYRPVDCLDIVLAGDVLDLINSDRWLAGNVRPWSRVDSRELLETVSQIVDRVLQMNRVAAQSLRSFSKNSVVRIASASDDGKPVLGMTGQAVPVRVHYMVGEHDWMLHLPGSGYDLLRQKVIQYFGLCQTFDSPFPHESSESKLLRQMLTQHRVHAAHGDIADPFSFHGDRAKSCLSNVLSIELLQRYVTETIESAGRGLPELIRTDLLSLLDCVDAFEASIQLSHLLKRSISSKALLSRYQRNWNSLVEHALRINELTTDAIGVSESVIAQAREGLLIGNRTDHSSGRQTRRETLYRHAFLGSKRESQGVRFSVYGHSHCCDSVALRSAVDNDGVAEHLYFNTGSWRPELPAANYEAGAYTARQQIALHAFYKDDERCGRPFEIWQGTLGTPVADERASASDQSIQSTRAMRSLAKASALSRPHFLSASERETGTPRGHARNQH